MTTSAICPLAFFAFALSGVALASSVLALLGGAMGALLSQWGTELLVRLAPDDVLAALERPHTRRMDFTGRVIKSMLYVDAHGTDSDDALQEWIDSACAFVQTLPLRKPAPRSRSRRSAAT